MKKIEWKMEGWGNCWER